MIWFDFWLLGQYLASGSIFGIFLSFDSSFGFHVYVLLFGRFLYIFGFWVDFWYISGFWVEFWLFIRFWLFGGVFAFGSIFRIFLAFD